MAPREKDARKGKFGDLESESTEKQERQVEMESEFGQGWIVLMEGKR